MKEYINELIESEATPEEIADYIFEKEGNKWARRIRNTAQSAKAAMKKWDTGQKIHAGVFAGMTGAGAAAGAAKEYRKAKRRGKDKKGRVKAALKGGAKGAARGAFSGAFAGNALQRTYNALKNKDG